jgi:hypothetical protein
MNLSRFCRDKSQNDDFKPGKPEELYSGSNSGSAYEFRMSLIGERAALAEVLVPLPGDCQPAALNSRQYIGYHPHNFLVVGSVIWLSLSFQNFLAIAVFT